jgi:proteic killer suppression protein
MIKSFSDEATKALYDGQNTKETRRRFPQDRQKAILRKLGALNAATKPEDLSLPGLRLEHLSKTMPGFYSIRVDMQFRILFRFEAGHAWDVSCEDYHG